MGMAVSKQEEFWEACGFGHTENVRRFIAEGINVNWVSYTHNSCAIHVASQGKPEIVHMLIAAKCQINVQDDRGNLALHHAAMKGEAEIMQMLIDAGSKIDTQNNTGWTALINSAYFCQPSAAEVLISNKCDVNLLNQDERTALHMACRSQSEDNEGLATIVHLLVKAGSDVNAKSSDLGEADFTPLMFAAYHGHPGAANELLKARCDVNAQGSNQWTALHWAADRGHVEVIRLLLNAGINPLITGRRGELATDRAHDDKTKEVLARAVIIARIRLDQMGDSGLNTPVDTPESSPRPGNVRHSSKTHSGSESSSMLVTASRILHPDEEAVAGVPEKDEAQPEKQTPKDKAKDGEDESDASEKPVAEAFGNWLLRRVAEAEKLSVGDKDAAAAKKASDPVDIPEIKVEAPNVSEEAGDREEGAEASPQVTTDDAPEKPVAEEEKQTTISDSDAAKMEKGNAPVDVHVPEIGVAAPNVSEESNGSEDADACHQEGSADTANQAASQQGEDIPKVTAEHNGDSSQEDPKENAQEEMSEKLADLEITNTTAADKSRSESTMKNDQVSCSNSSCHESESSNHNNSNTNDHDAISTTTEKSPAAAECGSEEGHVKTTEDDLQDSEKPKDISLGELEERLLDEFLVLDETGYSDELGEGTSDND